MTTLPPLRVTQYAAIKTYGQWVERFDDYRAVYEYVASASDTVDDPDTPLHRIRIRVTFDTDDHEECAYQDRERALAWLRRFDPSAGRQF